MTAVGCQILTVCSYILQEDAVRIHTFKDDLFTSIVHSVGFPHVHVHVHVLLC